jgi:hypothetical protein
MPYSMQDASAGRRRGGHNQRRRAGRHVVWQPAGPLDLKPITSTQLFRSVKPLPADLSYELRLKDFEMAMQDVYVFLRR